MNDNDSDAAGGTVDVWLLDISGRDVAPLVTLLDAGERARADRYVSEPARRLFIASRAAQRVVAARYLHTDPRAVRLVRRCPTCGSTDHGRPTLTDATDLDFSVSHTGDLVALAFRRGGRVGLDVELTDRRVDVEKMVGSVLADREVMGFDRTPGSFYRLWTRKEATLKLAGHGLTVPLTDLDVSGELARIEPRPDGWPARPVRLADLTIPHHAAALATTGAAAVSVRLREAEVDAAV
jgi:4'-phosphopantetheinyl transferase